MPAYKPEMYEHIPLDELQTAFNNAKVIANSYWLIDPEGKALIYTGPRNHNGKAVYWAVQANANEAIAKKVCPVGCSVKLIPLAYVADK